jgi:hypothetical protein
MRCIFYFLSQINIIFILITPSFYLITTIKKYIFLNKKY